MLQYIDTQVVSISMKIKPNCCDFFSYFDFYFVNLIVNEPLFLEQKIYQKQVLEEV